MLTTQFHGAVQIVDHYHAREHETCPSNVVYGTTEKASKWSQAVIEMLDGGDVEDVIAAMRRLRPKNEVAKAEVKKAVHYTLMGKQIHGARISLTI